MSSFDTRLGLQNSEDPAVVAAPAFIDHNPAHRSDSIQRSRSGRPALRRVLAGKHPHHLPIRQFADLNGRGGEAGSGLVRSIARSGGRSTFAMQSD